MRWNVTDPGSQPAADIEPWETVEVIPIAPLAAGRRESVTLIGGLLVLGAFVGAGLWAGETSVPRPVAGSEALLPTSGSTSDPDPRIDARAPAASSAVLAPQAPLVVFLPAEDEVILGSVVVVAGRVGDPRPGPAQLGPSVLRVAVVRGDLVLGEADLRVVDQTFVGSVQVMEPTRGQVVTLRVSDRQRPDRILLEQRLVLGPGH